MRFWLLAITVLAILLLWNLFFVTTNMDELCMFHRLACLYPNAHLDTIGVENYTSHLTDYGLFNYHRSYGYIGITSSIMYYPLWSIWKSVNSYYFMGFIFFISFSITLVKSLHLEYKYAIIPMCYFPLAHLFIHDTGPVRLGLLTFPVASLLVNKLIDDDVLFHKYICGIITAIFIVFCVEDKPFYLYILPTLLFFIIGCRVYVAKDNSILNDVNKNKWPLLFSLLTLLIGIYILLFVGKDGGQTYFSFLKNSFEEVTTVVRQIKFIGKFTLSFPAFGHRAFQIPSYPLVTGLSSLPAIIIILLLIYNVRKIGIYNRKAYFMFVLSYFSGIIVFISIRNTWASHHFVFLHLPLISLLLITANSNQKLLKISLSFVCITAILSIVVLSVTPIGILCARERKYLFNYLSRPDIASKNIINFSTWGGYYHQSLYGNINQLVIWSPNAEEARKLSQLAKQINRNIINVCVDCDKSYNCDKASLLKLFSTTDVNEVELGLKSWKLYEITPNKSTGNNNTN